MEWVKRNILRRFGHIERMGNEEFGKVYQSSVEGPNRRGRPLGRREDKVREYVMRGERGEIRWSGQGGSVLIGRGGDPSAVATLFRNPTRGSEALELLID